MMCERLCTSVCVVCVHLCVYVLCVCTAVSRKSVHPRKSAHPLLFPTSCLCVQLGVSLIYVANEAYLWSLICTASCAMGKETFCYTSHIQRSFAQMDVANVVHTAGCTTVKVILCCSERCVLSGHLTLNPLVVQSEGFFNSHYIRATASDHATPG